MKIFPAAIFYWWIVTLSAGVAGAEIYDELLIRQGHQLKITVSRHPEFTQEVLVRSDGTTDYPLLIGVPVDGLTPREVRDLLIPILLRFESEPQVFVTVSETRIIRFQVQGAVHRPGSYQVETPVNVQQAVVIAGGFTPEADIRFIHILRLKGESRQEITIDAYSLFRGDSIALAPPVEDNDIILVNHKQDENLIHIFGAVNLPGGYLPGNNWNVADAIQAAGGISPTGNGNKILIIKSPKYNAEKRRIKMSEEIENGRYYSLPKVSSGDIIIVYKRSNWTDMDYWTRLLQFVTVILSASLVIAR